MSLRDLSGYGETRDNTAFRTINADSRERLDVEVGDSKQADFKPQIKLMRWGNEVNFSVRAEEDSGAVVRTDGETIKYVTRTHEVHLYQRGDEGFELEWLLPTLPASNVLRGTIQSKGLNFFYQPRLTRAEVDAGAFRPDHIIGSYAVYHAGSPVNYVGNNLYRAGKFGHIHRPKAIDATGREAWCVLLIEAGILTVTVPQRFLDTAAYPVRVDPNFGYDTIGGSFNTMSDSSELIYVKGTIGGTGGTLTNVTAYLDETSSANQHLWKAALYDASLAYIDETPTAQNVPSTPAWVTSTDFASPPSVTASTAYQVGAITNTAAGALVAKHDSGSAGDGGNQDGISYPTFPDPISATNDDRLVSIYGTYVESGGAANPKGPLGHPFQGPFGGPI